MSFRLEMQTSNAAFLPDVDDGTFEERQQAEHAEIVRILRKAADELENGNAYGACKDVNGNTVGGWSC